MEQLHKKMELTREDMVDTESSDDEIEEPMDLIKLKNNSNPGPSFTLQRKRRRPTVHKRASLTPITNALLQEIKAKEQRNFELKAEIARLKEITRKDRNEENKRPRDASYERERRNENNNSSDSLDEDYKVPKKVPALLPLKLDTSISFGYETYAEKMKREEEKRRVKKNRQVERKNNGQKNKGNAKVLSSKDCQRPIKAESNQGPSHQDSIPLRKRGRPKGKRRTPLTPVQKRERNAFYEKERRKENKNFKGSLIEVLGIPKNTPILQLLEIALQHITAEQQRTIELEAEVTRLKEINRKKQERLEKIQKEFEEFIAEQERNNEANAEVSTSKDSNATCEAHLEEDESEHNIVTDEDSNTSPNTSPNSSLA